MNELSELSASEARRLIGRGDISPTELLEACISRIEAVNPKVNAIVATDLRQARREAKIAENAVLAGNVLPPLHGLPIGIKDLNATRGLRTTWGSKLFENHVPTEDDALVARLRAAGGIIVGKTNTPEFGSGTATNNLVYGPTRNPFDLKRTSGGSSGGRQQLWRQICFRYAKVVIRVVASEIRQRGAALWGFVQHRASSPKKIAHSITHISMYRDPWRVAFLILHL